MPATWELIERPAALPVTLTQAKAHLRVLHAYEDELIGRLAAGACADATAFCGVGAGVGRYRLTLDGFPLDPIRLPVRPVVAVVAVAYWGDGTQRTVAPTDYWVGRRSGRVCQIAPWPCTQPGRPDAVEVEFFAGLDPVANPLSVPPQMADAILLIVGDRYAHRGDGDDRRAIPAAAGRLLTQLHTGEVC